MSSLGDLGNIMKQAQQLQERLSQVQETVARQTVEASAGGGMVKVVVNGKHEVLSLTIDPSVLKEDVELVQDLVLAAVNEGIRNAQKMVADEMTKATGGLKIPGLG
jgi:DNA-binding YbaB/EbfC family protein